MAGHLILQERELLYRLLKKGKSKTEIAEVMGRDRSTIYRELSRNTRRGGYEPELAQRLADRRRRACRRPRKLDDADTHEYVRERLRKAWSPDQIAGRRHRDCRRRCSRWFSRQTIYNWIDEEAPGWRRWLRRGGRPPEKRGKLIDCVRIDGRPEVINRRRRYGDWEGDTVVGFRTGPLNIESRIMYTPGQNANHDIQNAGGGTIHTYQPINPGFAYMNGWTEIWTGGIDYASSFMVGRSALTLRESPSYDKYGRIFAALAADAYHDFQNTNLERQSAAARDRFAAGDCDRPAAHRAHLPRTEQR